MSETTTIFQLPENFLADVLVWFSGIISDLLPVIILIVGLIIGFFIFEKIIETFSDLTD